MPRIQWTGLPPALRDHLFERLRERKITAEDLYQLKTWRESDPEAPDGLWYKDFGSFKICGEGEFPKTFLLAGHAAKGEKRQLSSYETILAGAILSVEIRLATWAQAYLIAFILAALMRWNKILIRQRGRPPQ